MLCGANKTTNCLEEIFHEKVRQLVSGSKALLPSPVCSSRSPLPLAPRFRRLAGLLHRWNGTFPVSVQRKERRSSFQAVPGHLQHPNISQCRPMSPQTPTHNPCGVCGIIHPPRTLVHKEFGQIRGSNEVYTYLEAALWTVERREVIGLTISHNRYTQGFLVGRLV